MSSAYHHGDLRSALVAAALTLVEQGGAASLSLRGAARAAGVSAMAPYHHFADRAALVAAVAVIGFRRLYDEKLAALAQTTADPRAQLVAGTRAYVGFILANPELYRLMKAPELAERRAWPELAAAAAAPSQKLRALLEALAAAGGLAATSPDAAALTLWSFAHGTGLLAIDGYLGGDSEAILALAENGAAALLGGFAEPPQLGRTASSSISNSSTAPGGMTPPAPLAP